MQYAFTDRNRNRKLATAQVSSPFGLSPHDELYLYGLLALTFSQPEPSTDFYATPHWCLKALGIVDSDNEQGKRYQLFRDAIRRLSGVIYENDRFYDPVRGEHRDVAFGLLKYSLPIDQNSTRAWHFVWDAQFFRMAESIKGSFIFDFEMYRSLDPASRRLFLLLQKIFWRNDQSPAFEIRQLGVGTLGFSETLETKRIKQKLLGCANTLLVANVIQLPVGVSETKKLFEKRGKGNHVVRFSRGAYFDQLPVATFSMNESPLIDPLKALGFDDAAIQRILKQYKPRLIQEWTDITLAAIERKLIKQSPQAYFTHYINEAAMKRTTPPDWWREQQKREFQSQYKPTDSNDAGESEETAFQKYLESRGREAFERVMQRMFDQYREAGQSETLARQQAQRTARMQLRRQFQEEHPEQEPRESSSLAMLLRQHLDNERD